MRAHLFVQRTHLNPQLCSEIVHLGPKLRSEITHLDTKLGSKIGNLDPDGRKLTAHLGTELQNLILERGDARREILKSGHCVFECVDAFL